MSEKVKIGIIGLGMMGRTHYEAYGTTEGAEVVAVADADPKRAAGNLAGTEGNVLSGGISQLPMDRITGTTDFQDLLELDLDIVDVCVPTPYHVDVATAALASGKNVLCEKPLAGNSADAKRIAGAAAKATGMFMPAMCMRFWPQWEWLKQAVVEGRYGKVVAATFRRVASMPAGWYKHGEMSGGAILDLHIHDTDFVYHLFGRPTGVFSRGYSKTSGKIDHVATQFLYDQVPLVTAEGGWCLADGFGFSMRYTVNFERATADFDLGREQALQLNENGRTEPITLDGTGYQRELQYFIDCVRTGRKPSVVTADDAVESIRIVEAEGRSIESGRIERV